MDTIKQYHLHKDDYAKLHFEINDSKSYLKKIKSMLRHPTGIVFIKLFGLKGRKTLCGL